MCSEAAPSARRIAANRGTEASRWLAFHVATWDLWLDYHRRDADGLTHGNARNARPEVEFVPGRYLVVGNEEADPAVAVVVRINDNGVVLIRVLPGSVEYNRASLTLPKPH